MDLPTFVRTYKTRSKNIHWFLGAGTSANAGIKTAWEMTWEFKRDIYCSENGKSLESCKDLSNPRIRSLIQNYLDSKSNHPEEDSLEEYSHYFSLAYRSEGDRRKYIERKIKDADIRFSHRVLAALLANDLCKAVWTTNFDYVIEESWQSIGMQISKLNTASIDNSIKASQCLRDDRFPLYVKLHGDFQSTSLKNTTSELKAQDEDFKDALLNLVGTKFGFAFAGYSGRDDSIMEVLESILEKADSEHPGIFWFNRIGSEPIPRVQNLIEKARDRNIDAHIVDIPSFDELMLNIYKFLSEELSDFSSYLQPSLDRKSPVPLVFSKEQTDVIRTNAFKVTSTPHTVYQFETEMGGIAEVKQVLQKANNVLATRVKEGVLAFGDRDEIASIFDIANKSEINVQPFKTKRYKTSELFLLYQVLEKAFCSKLPLLSHQGASGVTLYIDPNANDISPLSYLKQSLISKFDSNPQLWGHTPGKNSYWSECVRLRLEETLDSLWLFISPSIYIADREKDWNDPKYVKQEDFRKNRLGGRYNKQSDDIFDGWAKCLGLNHNLSGKKVVQLKAFQEDLGVNPALDISTVSAFSRGGKADG
ncbi:SIR2 family protein [Teredinibacter turnerae]|uniref:SIR2 family protein n=1 Tax=Teredinibacter turnerae TaxID=2426 RepID=UPI0003747474|nr:SIR2 family protein [Teredinibacter turnerae]